MLCSAIACMGFLLAFGPLSRGQLRHPGVESRLRAERPSSAKSRRQDARRREIPFRPCGGKVENLRHRHKKSALPARARKRALLCVVARRGAIQTTRALKISTSHSASNLTRARYSVVP